jgi:hypothetical protein
VNILIFLRYLEEILIYCEGGNSHHKVKFSLVVMVSNGSPLDEGEVKKWV